MRRHPVIQLPIPSSLNVCKKIQSLQKFPTSTVIFLLRGISLWIFNLKCSFFHFFVFEIVFWLIHKSPQFSSHQSVAPRWPRIRGQVNLLNTLEQSLFGQLLYFLFMNITIVLKVIHPPYLVLHLPFFVQNLCSDKFWFWGYEFSYISREKD